MMRVCKSLVLGTVALLASMGAGSAQVLGDAVIATVNDRPISTFDVQQRLRLMMITNGQIPEEAQAQFQQQALRDLVEEELKRQETEERSITIPENEVTQELARIAASGGTSIEQLIQNLQQSGIAVETLQEKIRTDKAWQTLVRARFGSRVTIRESEIDRMLSEMKAEKQAEQYLVSEICLPVDSGQQREQVYGIGMEMLNQLQRGVPFQALAQRFSVCPSAARGGDLGWLRRAEFEGEVAEVLEQLGKGNISTPVETDNGELMKLVALRDKRAAAEKGDPSYELAYAGVPKGRYSRQEAEEKLSRLPLTGPCQGDGLSEDLGADIGIEHLPMLPIDQFREPFQDTLIPLRRGDTSELLESTGAWHMVFVCEMDEGLGLPRRQAIESRLEAKQFELLARRYLRDLERDSDIDIRLEQEPAAQDS